MIKRVFDILAAFAGLVISSPLLLLVAILIKLDSPGPIFHRACRVGRNGRSIRLFKFRTMNVGAAASGPGITTAGDKRVTRIGRFLRKSKLDEFPQLINVLVGDMSLVGPRPEDPKYVAYYTPAQLGVLKERPGITSPASIHYRNEEQQLTGPDWEKVYINQILPDKLKIELDYLSHRTLFSDLIIIFKTFLPELSHEDRS